MKRDAKLDAIRAVLTRAGRPLRMAELLPRVENRMRQVVGRARLYQLLATSKTTGLIAITGRADSRAYALPKRRAKA